MSKADISVGSEGEFLATSLNVEPPAAKTGQQQTKPRVSIGVPVFNGERYVAECLEALLQQTFADFEVIVCDNASQDRTEEICRSYAATDPRVHYFRSPTNLGAAQNYRRSFQLSSGEYFKWQPCDDRCGPDFLARCVEVLDSDPSVVLAYPKTKLINSDGHVTCEYEDRLHLPWADPLERFRQLHQRLALCNAMYGLVRAEALAHTGLVGNFIGGDIPLLAELTLYGKFCEVPQFSFYRRFHDQASSSYKKDEQILEFYDPQSKYRAPLTRWKHLGRHFRSVVRAPIGFLDKLRLAMYLFRMVIWSRQELASEFLAAGRVLIRAAFASSKSIPQG